MSTLISTRRALTRPRPSLINSNLNTASTPNLSAAYNNNNSAQPPFQQQHLGSLNKLLGRKSSLSALTQGSLATIPDATESYGLSAVLDDESPTLGGGSNKKMAQTPGRQEGVGDLEVGDLVDVPGAMFGTVRFLGSVQGKKGMFAGVELSREYASRGKNNGDVDGVSYFNTDVDGAGIFLPINRATKRGSPQSSFPLTPTTPSINGLKTARQVSSATPPTPSVPKFSQSVGPGRAPSPQFKKSRPSLPRPESPVRKLQLAGPGGRPSIGTPAAGKPGVRYAASPTPGKFGQSVMGTRDTAGDPNKRIGTPNRMGMKASVGPRSASALGQAPLNYSDDETTPIGVARTTDKESLGSVSSFYQKMRPAEVRANEEELARLRTQLEERDRQLKDQASTLAEMESSLAEVQSLMNGSDAGGSRNRGSMEDKDAAQLRSMLREKNEKIAMLTSEFDAHRADFRSTIDTLEMASTETERVYEKRVEDLIQELRDIQERTDDVDSVARQFKQLEELVQELEEGLEDARRGEAEARGEVEFLRGEVERGRSELRREREKAAAAINGGGETNGNTSKEVEQRDDEIRGLKAIIHSLSRDAVAESNTDPQKTPTQRNGSFTRGRRTSGSADITKEKLEREIAELRTAMEAKATREDELERELERLRRSSAGTLGGPGQRSSAMTVLSNGTVTQEKTSTQRDSKGAVVSWRERDREPPKSPQQHRRGNTLETMPESDTYSSTTDNSSLWCEICETGGHDILTCTNMFGGPKQGQVNGEHPPNPASQLQPHQRTGKDVVREAIAPLAPKGAGDGFRPVPLAARKAAVPLAPVAVMPNLMDSGPVAGKESGVIDANKWCALCERDGHESVDCPFEEF